MSFGYFVVESKRALRSPRYLVFTIGMPTILFFIYINVFPNNVPGTHIPYAAYLVPTLAALGAYMAAMASAAHTAVERSTGWQRQLRLTPLTTMAYLSTKVLVAMLQSIVPIAVICLLGLLVKHVQLSASAWTQIILGTWLAALPFALLGLVIGQIATARNLPTFTSGLITVMSLLGGLLIPVASFPQWMVDVAKALPTYWIGEIGRRSVEGNIEIRNAVLVLAAWGAAAALVVAWRYQRAAERVV
jgi:ABC-2 type transport system permease protein